MAHVTLCYIKNAKLAPRPLAGPHNKDLLCADKDRGEHTPLHLHCRGRKQRRMGLQNVRHVEQPNPAPTRKNTSDLPHLTTFASSLVLSLLNLRCFHFRRPFLLLAILIIFCNLYLGITVQLFRAQQLPVAQLMMIM